METKIDEVHTKWNPLECSRTPGTLISIVKTVDGSTAKIPMKIQQAWRFTIPNTWYVPYLVLPRPSFPPQMRDGSSPCVWGTRSFLPLLLEVIKWAKSLTHYGSNLEAPKTEATLQSNAFPSGGQSTITSLTCHSPNLEGFYSPIPLGFPYILNGNRQSRNHEWPRPIQSIHQQWNLLLHGRESNA